MFTSDWNLVQFHVKSDDKKYKKLMNLTIYFWRTASYMLTLESNLENDSSNYAIQGLGSDSTIETKRKLQLAKSCKNTGLQKFSSM